MNSETCTVLTGAFPLILIAVVADRRSILPKLRRLAWYRNLFITTIASCLVGLAYAVIGVQLNGLALVAAVFLWGLFGLALLVFAISVLLSAATLEVEEDRLAEEDELKKSLRPA
jgi:hypothetical protein